MPSSTPVSTIKIFRADLFTCPQVQRRQVIRASKMIPLHCCRFGSPAERTGVMRKLREGKDTCPLLGAHLGISTTLAEILKCDICDVNLPLSSLAPLPRGNTLAARAPSALPSSLLP